MSVLVTVSYVSYLFFLLVFFLRISNYEVKRETLLNQMYLFRRKIMITSQQWTDTRLAWDPSTADGITGISMKADAVWLPDVYPCERYAD